MNSIPPSRKATAYLRAGRLLLNRVDTTVDGIPVSTDDVVTLAPGADPADVGRELIRLVGRARTGIPSYGPSDWDRSFDAVLAAAGVRSWRQFMRGAKDVSVFEDAGVVRFLPSDNLGATEGFGGREDQAVEALLTDAIAVGQAALEALERSA